MAGIRSLRRVCVFCGSNAGHDRRYAEAAADPDRTLALRDMTLVYRPLIQFFEHAIQPRFIRPEQRRVAVTASSAGSLLDGLAKPPPPAVRKWIRPEEF